MKSAFRNVTRLREILDGNAVSRVAIIPSLVWAYARVGENPSTWSVNTTRLAAGDWGAFAGGDLGAAAGNLLVARDPLATAAAADHVYSCAGERILSIIPAGPPPAPSRPPPLDISAAQTEAVIGPDRLVR